MLALLVIKKRHVLNLAPREEDCVRGIEVRRQLSAEVEELNPPSPLSLRFNEVGQARSVVFGAATWAVGGYKNE